MDASQRDTTIAHGVMELCTRLRQAIRAYDLITGWTDDLFLLVLSEVLLPKRRAHSFDPGFDDCAVEQDDCDVVRATR